MDDFDKDGIEVLGGSVTAKALSKMNEVRGAVGGMMLNHGVKNYILYSHPYNFTNLCYDNCVVYDRTLDAIKTRFNVDFSDVFRELRGDKAYNAALKVMDEYIRAVHEDIPRLKWEGSLAQRKLNELEQITLSDETVRAAILEAYDELPDEKKDWMKPVAVAWGNMDEEDFTERLSEKYKVTKTKKHESNH